MSKIRFGKIVANAGEAFFVTLAGVLTVDSLANLEVPPHLLLITALVPGIIQFGLTFCREWAKAEEDVVAPVNPGTPKTKLTNVLTYLVLQD